MRYSTVLDIGSSKVICMVVSGGSDGAIIVHGMGVEQYGGYRMGSMPDKRELADAVRHSINAAAAESQKRIREVCVGVPSPFMHVISHEGDIEIASRDGRISNDDIEYLLENSFGFEEPANCSLIHSTPSRYLVDGTAVEGSPVGLPAQRLSALVSHCYVDNAYKACVTDILRSMGLTADMFISSALATAYFTVPDEGRTKGAVLVDCGGTHTDVSFICDNALFLCESIGIGGRHFTGDLCYGLRLPEDLADDLKKRYVFGLDYGESSELVRIPGEGLFEIEHSTIQMIIESRAEELCEFIGDICAELGSGDLPVWLVGGGFALMRGAGEFMAKQLGRRVNTTMPFISTSGSVGYAAAFGIADFALFRCGKQSALKNGGRRLMRSLDRQFKF